MLPTRRKKRKITPLGVIMGAEPLDLEAAQGYLQDLYLLLAKTNLDATVV